MNFVAACRYVFDVITQRCWKTTTRLPSGRPRNALHAHKKISNQRNHLRDPRVRPLRPKSHQEIAVSLKCCFIKFYYQQMFPRLFGGRRRGTCRNGIDQDEVSEKRNILVIRSEMPQQRKVLHTHDLCLLKYYKGQKKYL